MSHGLKVMTTMDKAIARLEHPEKVEQMMNEIGVKHVKFKAIPHLVTVRNFFFFFDNDDFLLPIPLDATLKSA